MKSPDIRKEPTLYVVPYAHLDTQWRWDFPQTISEYLLKTMRVNFDYIDKYPHYVFNWTGANRYRLMREYFPSDYARLKQYVAEGRWFPAGSSVEEGDVNLPSAEGIIRQVLYGNTWFRQEFGKASNEYMLPDCFGFPASLPSILAHAGVTGFSTQKLSADWQPAPKVGGPGSPEKTPEGIPYNVGIWIGPDGKTVMAALNPGDYGSKVYTDLSKAPPPPPPPPQLTAEQRAHLSPGELRDIEQPHPIEQDWLKRVELDGKVTGIYADYHYVGTGDIGGATTESSVKLLEAIVTKSSTILPPLPVPDWLRDNYPAAVVTPTSAIEVGNGPLHIVEAAADQMFNAIKPAMQSRLPSYKGDLELINHSAGSLTSEAYHKRWIRENEVLGDAAEKASVAAQWLGGRSYPQQRLNDAWMLVMGGHFHDTAAGTATPVSYQYAWNDDIIALNQFATVLTSATEAVASGMDTQTSGQPLVVYNGLTIAREDIVEATIPSPSADATGVRVIAPDGREVPSQIEDGKLLFVAKVPSAGYAIYDVQSGQSSAENTLKVTESSLENQRYRVTIDSNGDVSSIFDKALNKELLSAPIRLAISTDRPLHWPAWNMDFDQEQAAPRTYVSGPAQVRVAEHGPVRVSIEVTREAENSKFVQTVSLSAGDAGNRVEFGESIDWRTLAANLKVTFPLSAANENATYNWDIGTVQRPTQNERQFEVASHRWIDLTDKSGSFGTTLLTNYKNASDKLDGHTIRLTLIRSPGLQPAENGHPPEFSDQANQDWGHHEIRFALAGHAGDWRGAGTAGPATVWQAFRLNQPLLAFSSAKHPGSLGTGSLAKTFSLLQVDNPRIQVMALKKAELSDEVVLRMVEMTGQAASNVKVKFAGPILSAREVNGQELPLATVAVPASGELIASFGAYQPRTFALKLAPSRIRLEPVNSAPIALSYDLAAATNNDTATPGAGFDGKGNALAAEMLPPELIYNDVEFKLGAAGTGSPNALVAKGQSIALPDGRFNRVYLLAAAAGGDQTAPFEIAGRAQSLTIQDWGGFVGQWDTRIWANEPPRDWGISANHAVWPPPPDWPKGWEPRYPEDYVGLQSGYVKSASIGWYVSHHHTATGLNEPYQYSYLFVDSIELPAGAKSLKLPDNDQIRILAVSVAQENPEVKPAQPLFDTLGRTEPGPVQK